MSPNGWCRCIFFLVAMFCYLGQTKLVCDTEGLHEYYLYNNLCYYKGTVEVNFLQAEYDCNYNEAALVSIHDDEQNRYVKALGQDIFIGLTNRTNVIQWVDGSPVDYTNYASDAFDQPVECFTMVDGLWENVVCGTKHKYICEKKAIEVPDSTPSSCPADIVYSDYATIYSPGYPDFYEAKPTLQCTYRLRAKEGYNVMLEVIKTMLFNDNSYFRVYEGWTNDEDKLLKQLSFTPAGDAISTNNSNLMLVEFHGEDKGQWEIAFYAEVANPTTQDPSIATTTPVSTANCPSQNEFYYGKIITSPDFPFAYAVNTNCMYYFRNDEKPEERFHITILELQIGDDDCIDFIDLRSNTIFASTKQSVQEESILIAPFPVGVNFRSGNTAENFGRWRIQFELY